MQDDFDATGFQKGKIHRKWPSPVNRSGQLKDQSLIDRSMTFFALYPAKYSPFCQL